MIRIAVTGPESTGKSWLTEKLAAHFHSLWVPEYAREYLGRGDGTYDESDLLAIARGQFEQEKAVSEHSGELVFCDTEFTVLYIWSEVRFGKVHPWIAGKLKQHRYDLYLLCDTDIPWEYDPLREHPGMRDWLLQRYTEVLQENHLPFKLVSGIGEVRLRNALDLIRSAFPQLNM